LREKIKREEEKRIWRERNGDKEEKMRRGSLFVF